jgi:hypothetical protein
MSGAQVSEALNPNRKYQTRMEMMERVGRSSLMWQSVRVEHASVSRLTFTTKIRL